MSLAPQWSTACPDWEERIVEGRSLIPFDPLFPQEAEAGLEVFNSMRIADLPGRPTIGEVARPWTTDLARAFFGSLDQVETGVRYINDYHLDIAKKNIKSTFAAALLTTALVRNFRESGEFYILAPTKEIADNSFIPARDMVRADPELSQLLHVKENQREIIHRITRATAKVIAADSETVGGKKTIGLIIDELWLFGKKANAEAMIREAKGGLASRKEGFVISLSTKPDGPPAGVYAQRLEYFRGVRDGKINDPRSLGVLYEYPQRFIDSGEYKKREYFYIPNPNLGASVDEQFLLDEMAKAEHAGKASVINFYAKHLNVQPSMALRADGWAGAMTWARGAEPALTLDELLRRSEVVTIGIDGGGNDDIFGIAVIGREKGTKRWLVWTHGFISTIGAYLRKANAADYLAFKKAGDLTIFRFRGEDEKEINEDPALVDLFNDLPPASDDSEALPPDIQFVVNLVLRIERAGLLGIVGVDRWGIGALVDALADIGITQDAGTLDPVPQGGGLASALKSIERKLADGSFRHGDQAILNWCVSNMKIVPTPTGIRVAREEAGLGKIDLAVAMLDAAKMMELNPEPTQMAEISVW